MMPPRSFLQHTIRAFLMAIVFLLPLGGPLPRGLMAAMMGAWIAYEGVDRRIVIGSVSALLAGEFFWSFDLGVLSLSYIIAILIACLAGAMFSLSPWRAARGWNIPDFLRAGLIATFFAVVMSVCSVGIESWIYGRGMTVDRVSLYLPVLWRIPIYALIILALLRRIDVPWRQPIQFG
jgi:hypothetical protein